MILTQSILEPLCLGTAFLGSGGGGEPTIERRICETLFQRTAQVLVKDIEDFSDDALIVPIAYIGPLVLQTELPSLEPFRAVLNAVARDYSRPVSAVMPGEIGGGNALTPLIASLLSGIPLVDADLIGRAFPELSMSSVSVIPNDISVVAYLASPQGNVYRFSCASAQALEAACRQMCILEGTSLVMAIYPMTGAQAKKVGLRGAYRQALALGKALQQKSPIEDFVPIGNGVIRDIQKTVEAGFLVGDFSVESEETRYKVTFKNEYLAITNLLGQSVCGSPDIIAVLAQGLPVMVEHLQEGQKIQLGCYSAHPIWYTPEGLRVAGLRAQFIQKPIELSGQIEGYRE